MRAGAGLQGVRAGKRLRFRRRRARFVESIEETLTVFWSIAPPPFLGRIRSRQAHGASILSSPSAASRSSASKPSLKTPSLNQPKVSLWRPEPLCEAGIQCRASCLRHSQGRSDPCSP